MQFNPEESVKISIEHLLPGMFVTAIQQSEKVNLSHAGRVNSQASIQQLVSNGVKFVWVDQKLSRSGVVINAYVEPDVEPAPPVGESPEPQTNRRGRKQLSRDAAQKKAARIIEEAKTLAQKLLNKSLNNQDIHVSEIESWAGEMIDTALVDNNALQCVSALRNKDAYLLEHSVNVACLMVTFGRHLGFEAETLKEMAIGGIIHDVGKVKVDDQILHKPGKLTPEEFEHMKLHQVFADEIIANVHGLSQISRDVCLMHHEKLDGNGYPKGLKGDQLPIHGRMSGIVDIYDALTADRCYKQGMSSAEAFKIMLSLTPFHLDKELVYKFINCIGVYPVGSIVELSDGRVAIVWTANPSQPLKPEVKSFYSNKYHRFTDVAFIDLKSSALKIERALAPSQLDFDVKPFYDQ